ncbi:hypothetical protein D3C83_192460 [compost metagenome]
MLITEFQPDRSAAVQPNRDKPTDPSTRGHRRSGVYPELPPFSYGPATVLLETPAPTIDSAPGERIVTMLFENRDAG